MGASGSDAPDQDPPPRSGSRPIPSSFPTTGSFDDRTERSIVDAVLDGDRDAYRHLVERESAAVVRACHRVLGDLHEAEDVAQEAFVTAYRSLASWRADGPFGAWLTRIAVRLALRRVGQRRSVTWLDTADAGGVGASIAADPALDPATQAMRAERAADLRTAVSGLPEPYREVVVLRFYGELSLDEIARQTDRPIGTVKTHLRRGLLRLRETVDSGHVA